MKMPDSPSQHRGTSIYFRYLNIIIAAITLTLANNPATAEQRRNTFSKETRVKAAFIFNFAKFVAWPPETSVTEGLLNLCIADTSPLQQYLAALEGRKVQHRTIKVHNIKNKNSLKECQLVFLGNTNEQSFETLLHSSQGLPILTVSDREGFLDAGGMIELKVVSGKIRFNISLNATTQTKLTLSSQLLQLANKVIR